jgi:hypothetical protein
MVSQRVRQNKRSMAGFIGKHDGRPAEPKSAGLPVITGTAQVGQTLSSTNGGPWTGKPTPATTRQWKADGANISGANGATYTLTAAELGKAITLTVTGQNIKGTVIATSVATSVVIAA